MVYRLRQQEPSNVDTSVPQIAAGRGDLDREPKLGPFSFTEDVGRSFCALFMCGRLLVGRCGAWVEVRDVGPCRAVPGLTRCNGSAKGPLQSVWARVVGGTHRAGVSAGACSGCLFLDGGASEAWKDCSGGKQLQAAGSRMAHDARCRNERGCPGSGIERQS
jgi:hypothetical protein